MAHGHGGESLPSSSLVLPRRLLSHCALAEEEKRLQFVLKLGLQFDGDPTPPT